MSDSWIKGSVTTNNRIRKSVNNKDLADDIEFGLTDGKTIRLLAKVKPDGSIEYVIVNNKGEETETTWP